MIRIRTVGRREFSESCGRLWDLAERTFPPHLVIGIRAGGWWVAEEMRRTRNPAGVAFAPLTCRRPSSDVKGKSRLFLFALKVLPYFALNLLRLVEYYALTLPRCRAVTKNGAGEARIPDSRELDAIRSAAATLP